MSHQHYSQEPCARDGALDDEMRSAAEAPTAAALPVSNERYVHPSAARLFERCPWIEYIPLYGPSCRGVGPRITTAIGGCFFLNKGVASYLVEYNAYAMLRSRFGIDGTRYQRLATLRTMGWSVKAFTACISDTFSLFGYTKRWYCAGSCIAGAAFVIAIGVLPAKASSADVGAGFMFLSSFCMANVDILTDGHFSRLLRKRPEVGAPLVSFLWSTTFIASIVAAAIQGPLADKEIPHVAMFVSGACQFVTVVFFIFNWYGERLNRVERYEDVLFESQERRRLAGELAAASSAEPTAQQDGDVKQDEAAAAGMIVDDAEAKQPKDLSENVEVDRVLVVQDDEDLDDEVDTDLYIKSLCGGIIEVNHEVFKRNWRLYIYSAVMVGAVITQMLVTLFGTSRDLGLSSMAVAVVCCTMAFWACHIVAAKAIVFIFLDMISFVWLPGVMDSFYMATPECLPDGPHFTFTFYNTVTSIISNFAAVGGALAFTYIFAKRTYWCTFVCVLLLKEITSIFDIIIVMRWNLAIGIPDHALYILGDSVFFRICLEMSWMPVALLFSRICPRGSESMIYALVSGFTEMGTAMSSAMGSLLIELVWPVETVDNCDFSNVPILLVVARIVIPLAAFPLIFLLLPRARMCDPLDIGDGPLLSTKKEKAREPENSPDQQPSN